MQHRPHNFRALSKPKPIQKSQHKPYWPYIPLLVIATGLFILNVIQPLQKYGVLAYATNTSISGLLNATNQQRAQNGSDTLVLNQSLSSAAQAKANDMINRNYWSHNTPDGQEPWVFIDSTGYKYQRAGENLAYGFATSDDTITGWMNSPSHRDNLLDKAFSEVGFGFANGPDYNNSGPETVVVAMYAKPLVLAAESTPPAPAPSPTPVISPSSTSNSETIPTTPETTQQAPAPTNTPSTASDTFAKPVTTDTPITQEPGTQSVARIQTLTKGNAPWTLFGVGLVSGLAVMLLLVKHAAGLRHLLRDSERFILHHPLLDTTLVSLVLLGSFLSQTTGFIR